MNKNNLTIGLFTTLLLASTVVSADEKYPAADFQPSVVYQDDSYVKQSSSSSKQTAPATTQEVDSQYPAANFQPQILYSDDSYQHNKAVPTKKSTNNIVSSFSSEESNVEATVSNSNEKKKEDSTMTYLLGLIGLVAAGFFLFRNQSEPTPSTTTKKANVATPKLAANTGVAKYINKVSGTGVSRYVEKQVKTAKTATGVARYVAQQTLTGKAKTADKKTTGVERYMRDRG